MSFGRIGLGLLVFMTVNMGTIAARAESAAEILVGMWHKTNVTEWRAAPRMKQIIFIEFGDAGPAGGTATVRLRGTDLPNESVLAIYTLADDPRAGRVLKLSWESPDGRKESVNFHVRALNRENMTLEYPATFKATIQTRSAHFEKSR